MPISIPYNPVFFSYAIITPKEASLYVDSKKIDRNVIAHLGDTVRIKPYEAIFEDTLEMSKLLMTESTNKEQPAKDSKKFLISNKTSWALSQALGGDKKVEEARSLIGDAKAVKNETELEGMKRCHIRDGAALIEYFAWLEEELLVKGSKIDEVEGADILEKMRS